MRVSSWLEHLGKDDVTLLEGFPINTRDDKRRTALHIALYNRFTECIEYCVRANADIWLKDIEGKTSLHYACLSGSLASVKLLLKLGAHVNARDKHGVTPLMYAVDRHTIGLSLTVEELLKHGADINAQEGYSYTILDGIFRDNLFFWKRELVLHGAWFNRTPKKERPAYLIEYRRSLANCCLASRALARVLTHRRVHKDVIPLVVERVWATKDNEKVWVY